MDRRHFASSAAASAGAAWVGTSGLVLAPAAQAQGRMPEDGVDFISIDPPARVEAPAGMIEVVEFFWYKCPHCNRFEPDLERWVAKLPKDVAFRRVPVAFRDDFAPQQRLYYALEATNNVAKLHKKVFAAIHDEKRSLDNADQIIAWVKSQGVDAAEFTKHYESFSTQSKVSRATQLHNAYKASGVPSLGVAGRFYTDGALTPNMEKALGVVDFLLGRIRASSPKPVKKG
jgi:protein dithiol oxidoreductase (disulfide-forming)